MINTYCTPSDDISQEWLQVKWSSLHGIKCSTMSKLNSAWCHSVLLVVLQPETRQTLFLIFMLGWAIVGTGWPFSAVFCPTEHVESCQFQLAVYIKQTRRARKNTEDLERDRAPSNKRKESHKCGEGNCERDRKLAKTKLTTTWRYNNSPESSSCPRKQTTATWWYEDLLPFN